MGASRTAVIKRSAATAVALALFVVPVFAFAQVYGGGTYGSGVHGTGEVQITTTPVVISSGGGGAVVGSGPTAPGYINTNPTGTTTSSTANPNTPAASGGTSLTEAQIQSILGVLQSFGADQSVIDNVNTSLRNTATPGTGSLTFTRDLESGVIGEDVKALQIYLNTHGYILTESGPGSPGNETTKFGAFTRIALSKFQAANGITPAVGYFGPKTRALIK